MALVNWRNAATHPPAEPGWYPARTTGWPHRVILRWWSGKRFGLAVAKRMDSRSAGYYGVCASGHLLNEIEWSPDPFTWEDVA